LINSCFHIGRVMIHNITATFSSFNWDFPTYKMMYTKYTYDCSFFLILCHWVHRLVHHSINE
jgi:hypothetical protein